MLIRIVAIASLLASSLLFAPLAQACSPGDYYDPAHQICQPYPPTNCPPEFWIACAYPQKVPVPGEYYPGTNPLQVMTGQSLDRPDLNGTLP